MAKTNYFKYTNKYFLDRNLYLYINYKFNERKQKELGEKVGLSQGRVGNIIKDIDKRLEEYEEYLSSPLLLKSLIIAKIEDDATYTID